MSSPDSVTAPEMALVPPLIGREATRYLVAQQFLTRLPTPGWIAYEPGGLARAARYFPLVGLAVGALAALVWAIQTERSALAPLCAALGTWLVLGAAVDLIQRTGRGVLADRLRRFVRLPRADLGKAIAHAGFGITIIGIGALIAWEVRDIRVAQVGDSWDVGAYTITLSDVRRFEGPNYISTMADIEISRGGRMLTTLSPEKRFYPVAGMPTTEAAIANGVFRDIYVVIGDPQPGGGWAVRAFVKPFANWIWAGAIVMGIGGLFSLFDRRLRIAAGARARATAVPAE